jgi:glucose-1-phosphate thymidylyltransferase
VVIKNATVGPFASIGENTTIENSTIVNSLVQKHTKIKNANLEGSMIGNHIKYDGEYKHLSIGDYSVLE